MSDPTPIAQESKNDFNDVSMLIQQAFATARLLEEALKTERVVIPGIDQNIAINAVWAIETQLTLAQAIINGEEVPLS